MLLGDTRAFFAMYNIVQAAKLTAVQMDRMHKVIAREPDNIGKVLQEAMSSKDCLLLSYEQLCLPDFPLHLFSCAIEYAPQAALNEASISAASALLARHKMLHWVAFTASDANLTTCSKEPFLGEPLQKFGPDKREAEQTREHPGGQWYEEALDHTTLSGNGQWPDDDSVQVAATEVHSASALHQPAETGQA